MKELREQVVLPSNVDVTGTACAAFVEQVASRLTPGLERSVGPVHWHIGDTTGVDWTAEGFVDGALVVVCLRPSSREVSLLVDPRFARPAAQKTVVAVLLLLGALTAGIVVGAMRRSFGWGLVSFIAVVVASMIVDSIRHERIVRRAVSSLDRAAWCRRFQDAVATAVNTNSP